MILFLAVIVLSVATISLVAARRAHGAARVPIAWTVPAGARQYEARAQRPDGVFLALSLSADSLGARALTPAAAGASDTGWVLISTDWRAGSWVVWIRGCNSAGCAPWSNRVICLAGIPDTIWMLQRMSGTGVRPPIAASAAKRAAGRVGWGLDVADSTAAAEILHQEAVQLRERARLCELFGRWALRGQQQACP